MQCDDNNLIRSAKTHHINKYNNLFKLLLEVKIGRLNCQRKVGSFSLFKGSQRPTIIKHTQAGY